MDNIVPTDPSPGTATLHLVPVFNRCCAECCDQFFHPYGVLSIEHYFLLKLPVLVGFCQVAAIVDGNTCTGQRVSYAVADLVDTNELVIIEELGCVVHVDSTLVLHVNFLENLIDIVAEILVVLELVVDLPDRLVAAIADKSDVHLHLLGEYEVTGCHCIEDIEVDGTESAWCRAAACALEGDQLYAELFHGLDGGRFDTGIPVGGDASEIECELVVCA